MAPPTDGLPMGIPNMNYGRQLEMTLAWELRLSTLRIGTLTVGNREEHDVYSLVLILPIWMVNPERE